MRRLLGALAVLVLVGVAGYAQTFRGAINGTVTDPSGAVVAGADVKATEIATGSAHSMLSTSNGEFAFQDLPVGAYRVTVTQRGFQQTNVENVNVTAGSVYTVPVKLTVGRETTSVEVSAAALEVDTTTATQSDTITTKALQDIPLNGRDFYAVDRSHARLRRIFGGRVRFAQRHPCQPDELADRRHGQQRLLAQHSGGEPGRRVGYRRRGDADRCDRRIFRADAIERRSRTQRRRHGQPGDQVGDEPVHGSAYYYNRNEFYAAASPVLLPVRLSQKPRTAQRELRLLGGRADHQRQDFLISSRFEKQQYIIGLSGLATEPSLAWTDSWPLDNWLRRRSSGEPDFDKPCLQILWPILHRQSACHEQQLLQSVASTGYSYNGVAKIDHNFNDKHHLSVRWFGGQGSQTAPLGASPALATASSNLSYYFEKAPMHVQNYRSC